MFNSPLHLVSSVGGSVPSLEELATPITTPLPDEPPDLLPGLIPKDDIVVITGETNIGKSLLALEIVSSLATNKPLWGELAPAKRANKVLYALGEHRTRTIVSLAQHTKLPMTDKVLVLGPEKLGADKWLVVQGRPNIAAIDKFKRWAEDVDFLVFDPLASFIVGADTENDNNQMRLVIEVINSICMVNGASCIVLGHSGKPSIDFKGQEHVRRTYQTRGASGTEDAATNIWYFGKAETQSKSGDGRIYELNLRKFKGKAPEKYRLLRDADTLTHTLLNGEVKVDENILKLDAKAKFGAMLAEFPMYSRDIVIRITATALGISEETFRRRINEPA